MLSHLLLLLLRWYLPLLPLAFDLPRDLLLLPQAATSSSCTCSSSGCLSSTYHAWLSAAAQP
jgi:hypothetical protein